jgi:small-conductance mechanosensitive channel
MQAILSDPRRFWKTILFLVSISVIFAGTPALFAAKPPKTDPPPTADSLHPASVEEMNQLVSRLTDQQVRQILIQQLEKTIPPGKGKKGDAAGSDSGLMHSLDHFSVLFRDRFTEIGRHLPLFFTDIDQAVGKLTDDNGVGMLLEMVFLLSAIIGLSIAAERVWWRSSAGIRARFDAAPVMEGWMRFSTGILKILPEFLGIFIFSLTGGILFALVHQSDAAGWRLLFIAMMLAIIVVRMAFLLSNLLFAPNNDHLRLVPVSDTTARYLHRQVFLLVGYYGLFYIFSLLIQKLGVSMNSTFLILLISSIPFMAMIFRLIWNNRYAVADYLRQTSMKSSGRISWIQDQLASSWHILTVAYVMLLWVLGIGRFALFGPQNDMAFVISFLIIPLYLALDQAGKWVVRETLGTLRKTEIDENTAYYKIAVRIVRITIAISLVLWLFDIWGFRLPFIEHTVQAAFSILLTLIIAHVIWGMINRYIQQKLEAMAPSSEQSVDDEEEFSGQTLARSFTLLPVLRKFVGTVLMLMVSLIVLSSMGINIAPLMAGAGVVGLAIGFGSQKLVADVLSGIFYLVDDAFRVGEYIQAGSVSGTVEGFSLRNIELRHDRGALQIVPFSKLGAVTNYNRGGAVVKFALSLPYNTNIDQVRKIIKKVGQQLMEDPELSPDIIRPVKSMGVKSVVDSVMTFRVRFTAKFGRQGIIQRKAFELITDALAKKGIHYAHRRVIVEMPPVYEKSSESSHHSGSENSDASELLKAGAAAALTQILSDEDKQKLALSKKSESESA